MSTIRNDWNGDTLTVRCSGDLGVRSANDFLLVIKDTLYVKSLHLDLNAVKSVDHLFLQLSGSPSIFNQYWAQEAHGNTT